MFNLPVKFDQNEWFVLTVMVVLISAFYLSPKPFSKQVILGIMLFHSVYGLTVDMIIGVSYPWDFYNTMDTKGYDLCDFFIYTINYPIYGYFFAYFMTLWLQRGRSPLAFIAIWVLISALSELAAVICNVYQYKNGWNIGFSVISYVVIFSSSAFFVTFITSLQNKPKGNKITNF